MADVANIPVNHAAPEVGAYRTPKSTGPGRQAGLVGRLLHEGLVPAGDGEVADRPAWETTMQAVFLPQPLTPTMYLVRLRWRQVAASG